MLNCVDSFYKNFKFQISSFANPIKTFPIVNLTTGNFDIAAATFWTDYGEFSLLVSRELYLFTFASLISMFFSVYFKFKFNITNCLFL